MTSVTLRVAVVLWMLRITTVNVQYAAWTSLWMPSMTIVSEMQLWTLSGTVVDGMRRMDRLASCLCVRENTQIIDRKPER